MSVEKFIGCILRLKTRAGESTPSRNIIGTVRDIQIDENGQRICLDNGMANGVLLPDGFVVTSSEIADLSVISKAAEVVKEKVASPLLTLVAEQDLKKPKPLKNEKNILQEMFGGGVGGGLIPPTSSPFTPLPTKPLTSANTFLPPKPKTNNQQQPTNNNHKTTNGIKTPMKKSDTFEMTTAEIKSEEFNFEESNSLFTKLPVEKKGEKKALPVKNFTSNDTTYLQERSVESIKVQGKAGRKFLTDTGILVPSVDLSTRSNILNSAHSTGLSHSRMVEVMGRAVAEVTLPLLGDSYRLSPERTEDRPRVLVTCGPHWQGAVGLAAARILQTLGVQTNVYCPKEEIHLCALEEHLFTLGGGTIHRHFKDVSSLSYDAVIHSLDDHLCKLSLKNYKSGNVVLVDPPLCDSKSEFEKVKDSKVTLVTPALPLAYNKDVKVFLVNLGIPTKVYQQNSVKYASPFGAKLTVQLF